MECTWREHVGPIEVRRKMGGKHCQQQCLACRRGIGRKVLLYTLSDDGRSLRPWSTKRLGEGRGSARTRRYQDFQHSAAWRKQRRRVLEAVRERQGGSIPMCEGENCENQANSVHHVRYAAILEDTPDEDLRAACMTCQLQERQQRIYQRVMGS